MELNREQIVKTLECCAEGDCDGCPRYPFFGCTKANMAVALALIRELTEEKEQKNETIAGLIGTIKDAYGFAVRKMQERLKEQAEKIGFPYDDVVVSVRTIDQIAKEVLGENK